MGKTLITFNNDTVIVGYNPSTYSTTTNKSTRDIVSLTKKNAADTVFVDAILTEDVSATELSWKIGTDYFTGIAADITISLVQDLKQFVFTLTATPTSAYIIAATDATEAASIAAAQTIPLVGTVTATLPGAYYGAKGVVSQLI